MTEQIETASVPPALPSTLDPGAWIALALASKHPVERLLALDEIAFQGLASDFADDVRRLAAGDDSEETTYRAKQLMATISKKRLDQKIEKVELTPERTKALLEVGEEILRRTVQLSLRKAPAPEILDTWRAHILGEENGEVIVVGLTLLAKFGTPQDAGLASAFADHPSVSVVKAAIDLLHSQRLDLFKERAAGFLTSGEIEIRLHAIRKLRSFDPAEAQVYIRSMLSARDPMIRQRGLRELLLVPFNESEALYLAYLGAEPVPLLLVLAGSAVAMNPSADLPLKLYDIFSAARDTRAHILQLVIKQLLTAINASGILQESIEEYLEKLKESLKKRKIQTACSIAINDLSHEDPETRLEAVRVLAQGLDLPKVREALEQLQARETSEDVKEQLLQILGKTAQDEYSPDALRQLVREGTFYDLEPRVQKRHLSSIRDQASFIDLRETVGILLMARLDRSVLLHLFDRICTHGTKWDPKPLFLHLKHEDPGVVAAALRTIGKFDLDCISYEIPNFLRQDDVRVKTAALELYLVSDKPSALQYLAGLLKSPVAKIRKNSLSLLATVDFASVQHILMEFIPVEKSAEIRIQAAFILAANPTREGFAVLYSISHDVNGIILPEYQDLWDAVIAGAIPFLAPDIATLMDAVAKKKPEPAPKPEALPSYTFKKVTASSGKNLYGEKDQHPLGQALPQITEERARDALDQVRGFAEQHRGLLVAVGVLLAAAGHWWYSGDRFLLPGRSGSGSAVVHESPTSRMEDGGTKAPSMVAGTRGSPGQFISGSGYANSMKAMQDERLSISTEFARKSEQALQETLMKMADDPNYKGYAEFYLNQNCKLGLECIEKGEFKEARDYLMKALEDPSISEEARVLVCQSLLGIGYEVGDSAALEKAMDRLLAMIPEKELPKEYSRQAMKESFEGLKRMHEITPQQFSEIMQKLAKEHPGKVPPEMQMKMLEGFKQMQNRFK